MITNLKARIRKAYLVFGFTTLVGLSLAMSVSFMLAYFSPDKVVTFHVNLLGEANIELALFVIAIPTIFYMFEFIGKKIFPLIKKELI